jgi:hypothetical protein
MFLEEAMKLVELNLLPQKRNFTPRKKKYFEFFVVVSINQSLWVNE